MKQGIDVSVHNGAIDWQKVKASGQADFCIIRAGYGRVITQKDRKFEANYEGCKAKDIPCGAYWYSYAKTVDEARQEAEACITILRGKQFEYPIFFDVEEKATLNTGKSNCSAMIRAFCETLENAGYWVGLYVSRSVLQTYVEDDIRKRYSIWAAEWGSKRNYSGEVGMWQKTDKGKVAGISGAVDLDECYVDYPVVVKAAGKNGYPKPAEQAADAAEPAGNDREGVSDALQGVLEIGGKRYDVTLIEI